MKTSFQPKTLVRLCAFALLTTTAAMAQAATGNVTRGAVAVTTTMGELVGDSSVSHLIDQSGLASRYVSNVTAFDSFVNGNAHASGVSSNVWKSNSVTTGFLSFDLGVAYNIDGLAWFGVADSSNRVSRIKVYADNDSDATNGNGVLLFDSGTFSGAGSLGGTIAPTVFSFSSAANTRYLDIEILSNGGGPYSTLGEVVFRQTAAVAAVPEPGTYALMGLGLLAIGFTQRRRMAQR